MASLEDIYEALKAELDAIPKLRPVVELDDAVNVSGNACAALVQFAGANYLTTMGSEGDGYTFTITLAAPKSRAGRQMLGSFIDADPDSTTSLRNAINGTLDGLVAWVNVVSSTGFADETIGEGDYLTIDVTLDVGV